MRRITFLGLLALGCGPHSSQPFFSPRFPKGYLGAEIASVRRCYVIDGVQVWSEETSANRRARFGFGRVNLHCPNETGMREAIRDATKEGQFTATDLATTQIIAVDDSTSLYDAQDRRAQFVTDGWTILTYDLAAPRAVRTLWPKLCGAPPYHALCGGD